ncbi:MAG: hypothetical protein IKC35_01750 [Clostridia bacterium]|nr:hypothetical protein [Clostridia bacterium]
MNIKELMTDDYGKVHEFAGFCDEMISSRYILAEGKIIKILQTVAISTVLQRTISAALKGFDYEGTARDLSLGKIKPPLNEKNHVALVFCVLADIDSRKIFLSDFLRKFFWDGDINSSYASFVSSMLVPFKNFVVSAIMQNAQMDDVSVNFDRIERRVMDLADAIDKSGNLTTSQKEEYIFLCDNIAHKARTDIENARALAIGIKSLTAMPDLAPFVANLLSELGF